MKHVPVRGYARCLTSEVCMRPGCQRSRVWDGRSWVGSSRSIHVQGHLRRPLRWIIHAPHTQLHTYSSTKVAVPCTSRHSRTATHTVQSHMDDVYMYVCTSSLSELLLYSMYVCMCRILRALTLLFNSPICDRPSQCRPLGHLAWFYTRLSFTYDVGGSAAPNEKSPQHTMYAHAFFQTLHPQ